MFIKDELSKNAKGGTELMKEKINTFLTEALPEQWNKINIHASRVRRFDENVPSVFYMHDLPNDTESSHLGFDGGERFKSLVFVSQWQQQVYNNHFKISPNVEQVVIPNGIKIFETEEELADIENKWKNILEDDTSPINLIYHTTPHRGLDILCWWLQNGFNNLPEEIQKRIHVDVFSSFSIYGWNEKDAEFEGLFNALKSLPMVTYHGAVSNEEVRKYISKAHIFAYPSKWSETFCIAAVEAMSAQCRVATTNLSALPEVTGGLENLSPFMINDINKTAMYWGNMLENLILSITKSNNTYDVTRLQKTRVDYIYNWENLKWHWKALVERHTN